MAKTGFQQQVSLRAIEKAADGDIKSFEIIYQTYASACFSLAFRMTYSRAAAEDITQEAFLKVFKSLASYHQGGSFAGWVRKVLVNEAIDHLRSNKKLNLVFDTELTEKELSGLFDTNWALDAFTLEQYLAKLSATSRSVLILHEIEGYKHREIAELFNKTESFSKMALKRAYSELKTLVEIEEVKHASNG